MFFHLTKWTLKLYASMKYHQWYSQWWGLPIFHIICISRSALAGTLHHTPQVKLCNRRFVKLTLASCQWNIQVIENG